MAVSPSTCTFCSLLSPFVYFFFHKHMSPIWLSEGEIVEVKQKVKALTA